jgi:hypothetical protein
MFDTIRHLPPAQYDAVLEQRLDELAASMSVLLDALGRESADDRAAESCRA